MSRREEVVTYNGSAPLMSDGHCIFARPPWLVKRKVKSKLEARRLPVSNAAAQVPAMAGLLAECRWLCLRRPRRHGKSPPNSATKAAGCEFLSSCLIFGMCLHCLRRAHSLI